MCVAVGDPGRSGELEQELRREVRGRLREVRVDALDPAVLALGRHAQPLGRTEDPGRLEVRGLEQDVGRAFADLRLGAAHDPGERDRARLVGDHQIVRLEHTLRVVERDEPLPRTRAAHDHLAVQRVEVERVQRVPEREHHVVRDVDDVRDRAHARGGSRAFSHSGDGAISTLPNSRPM